MTNGQQGKKDVPALKTPAELAKAPVALPEQDIDIQIAAALRHPRSIVDFKQKCRTMATIDKETAQRCFYVLPKRRSRDGEESKPIEGPSVRLAEIEALAWRNLRVAGMIAGQDDIQVVCRGLAYDLENNVAFCIDVPRRIVDKNGVKYSPEMLQKTTAAGIKIAIRNAVFTIIPMAYTMEVYKECRRVAAGDASTLKQTRADALKAWQEKGVTDKMILGLLGRKGIEDVGTEDIVTLRGLWNAIEDEETTIEEVFSPKRDEKPAEDGKTAAQKLTDQLKSGATAAPPAAPPAEPVKPAAPAAPPPEPGPKQPPDVPFPEGDGKPAEAKLERPESGGEDLTQKILTAASILGMKASDLKKLRKEHPTDEALWAELDRQLSAD